MKIGDLVKSSKDCSHTTLGVVLDPSKHRVVGDAWVKVLFAGEIGNNKHSPANGVCLVLQSHLEVVNESR